MIEKRFLPTKAHKWLLACVACLVGLALAAVLAFGQTQAEPLKSPGGKKAGLPAQPAAVVQPPPAPSQAFSLVTPIPPFDTHGAEYVLLAWSDSGMRLVSDCDQFFSLGPPLVNLRAQLIKRGPTPSLVTQGVTLVYALDRVASPAGKSRYWEFSPALAGQKLSPDTGPQGNGQRGVMQAGDQIFSATGVPLMPAAADGSFLPYPTVTVEARDPASGRVLALTRAVLPVTTQLGCAKCHGGDQGALGLSSETAANILAAHDRNSRTKLLAEAKAGHPRSCAECHGADKAEMRLSASLHGFHAAKLPEMGAESCGFCHPSAPPTAFYRGVHHQRGLDCARCHGLLEDHALGLLKAEKSAGKQDDAARLMAGLKPRGGEMPARTAWTMQPDCNGCHDFVTRPKPDAVAFGKWNQDPANVFHQRRDQTMGLACAACHGPAHAIYPALNPLGRDRDNIQPMQYMGWAKAMGGGGNCGVCHTGGQGLKASSHHPIPAPVGTLVTLPPGFTGRMPGVLFPHQAHAGQDCRTCHHKGYQDGQGLTCSTSGCHDQASEEAQARYFRNAFHGQGFSCNYCHQQKRKAGQASGPVECGGCHVIVR
jgi:hypothetical protein